MKTMKAKNRITGEIVSVQYAPNSGGNMRLWVDGKFYSDKAFAKKFEIVREKEEDNVSKAPYYL